MVHKNNISIVIPSQKELKSALLGKIEDKKNKAL